MYLQEDRSRRDQAFVLTRKLILDQQKKLECPRLIGKIFHEWEVFLLHDNYAKLSTAKVYFFSDSVLCFGGRIAEYPHSVQPWKNRIDWFTQTSQYRELDNIYGEPVVLEKKPLSGHTTLMLPQEIQNKMEKNDIQPVGFKDRTIFMSMCNDIDWRRKGNE